MPPPRPDRWPHHVPPPGSPQWERHVLNWLLDQCPADYRLHRVLRQHPLVLAHLARLHVIAQVEASEQAQSSLRVRLTGLLEPTAIEHTLTAVAAERDKLMALLPAIDAVGQTLRAEAARAGGAPERPLSP